MKIKNCRVCNRELLEKPLLVYENMPSGAQYLPTKNNLKNDKGIYMEICQCSGCGLIQLNCDPVAYYKEVIRAAGFSEEMRNFRIKQFKKFVDDFSLDNKKIIEIGCGSGEYLDLMQKNNIKTFGLEYAQKSVQNCNEINLKVSQGYINNNKFKISNSPFDAFFILNFLEHLPNLNEVLGGIRNNLTDDAIGLIEVPNFDMILKKNLFFEFIRDHLFYFTKDTLETTLKLNGFDIIKNEVVWHDYIISATVRKRKNLSLAHFSNCQKNIKKDVDNFINKNKKIAIWGAGHEALAIMSMLKLEKKIKYVIDSAVFKQNKYTPATHLPIVEPNRLNIDPVDAIIVMAASYSDEVVKIIKQNYKNINNIAIIRSFGLEIIKNEK